MSQTVARGLLVLEALADGGPSSPQLLSEALGINRTIVHRILQSLCDSGFAEKSGGTYRLSHDLPRIAHAVEPRLRRAALIELTMLGEKTGLPAFIYLREGDQAIALISHVPQLRGHLHVVPEIGFAVDLAQSASGLVLLAFGPVQARQKLIKSSGRPREANDLIKDTVARGFADRGLNQQTGWDEISVPIIDGGRTDACLTILLSVNQTPNLSGLIDELKRSASAISDNLAAD